MRKPQGYATWTGDVLVEADTFTCCHCNTVVIVPTAESRPLFALHGKTPDAGGFCRLCMKQVCGPCADHGVCTPFERRLEQLERRDRLYHAMRNA